MSRAPVRLRPASAGLRSGSLGLAAALALCACRTATVIHSEPEGAKLYLDGQYVGETPVRLDLPDGMDNGYRRVRVEKPGYPVLDTAISRKQDNTRLVCGYFCFPTLLFMYKWEDQYNLVLKGTGGVAPPSEPAIPPSSYPL